MICRSEGFRIKLGGLQIVLQRCASPGGEQFRRAGGRHAREPVKPLDAERSQPGHADHAQDAFWQQRAARQGVRTTAGMAHDREQIDAQRIGDAGDVGGC
jgi:hypothetical protein